MNHSPAVDEAPTEKVPDGEAAKKFAEDIWKHLTTIGGEHLKTLLRPQSDQTPKDGGDPPEIPPEDECWQAFDNIATKHITETAEMLRKQLDNVLLFATLFSAINSAFLIYTLPTATASAQDPTNQLLLYVIRGLNNESAEDATNFLAAAETSGYTVNIIVNTIFSISFVLSIIATLIAVLGQTWVTNYGRDIAVDPKELRDERQRKLLGADRWYFQPVLEIVLPITLQAALIVFCGGFMVLLWSINTTLAIAVLPSLALGFLPIGASVGFALWDPGCPYQSPISSRILPKLISCAYALWYWVPVIVFLLTKQLVSASLDLFHWIAWNFCSQVYLSSWMPTGSGWQGWRAEIKTCAVRYHRKCQDLATTLKHHAGSPGIQHAGIVAWSLNNSSDPVAVSKVISILLHGDVGSARDIDISNDVYRHPVFEQLISAAGRYHTNTKTDPQQPVWEASYRAVQHVFLASSIAPVMNASDSGHIEPLLELEDTVSFLGNAGDLGRIEGILEVAFAIKLLNASKNIGLSDWEMYKRTRGHLKKVESFICSSLANKALAFHQWQCLGELVYTLAAARGSFVTIGMEESLSKTRQARIFSLYYELRRNCEPIGDGKSSPEFRKAHCIRLGSMMQDAEMSLGRGVHGHQVAYCRALAVILRTFATQEFQSRVVGWDFIHDQLKEVALFLKALPEGETYIELPAGELQRFCDERFDSVEVSQIQEGCLYLARKLVEAATCQPVCKGDHWNAEDGAGVGYYLLKIVDLMPRKDEALSIALNYLRFLTESSVPSLDWGSFGKSMQNMFRLCRVMTELSKRDQETTGFDRGSLEELGTMAGVINLKTLEVISEKWTAPMVWSVWIPYKEEPFGEWRHRFEPCEIVVHLADFLRGIEVKSLTEQQWNGLVRIESSLISFDPSLSLYSWYPQYHLPPEGVEYLEQMKIARDERKQLTTIIEDGHVPPRAFSDVPGSQSPAIPFGWRKRPIRRDAGIWVQRSGRKEERIEQVLEKPLQDEGGSKDPLDSIV